MYDLDFIAIKRLSKKFIFTKVEMSATLGIIYALCVPDINANQSSIKIIQNDKNEVRLKKIDSNEDMSQLGIVSITNDYFRKKDLLFKTLKESHSGLVDLPHPNKLNERKKIIEAKINVTTFENGLKQYEKDLNELQITTISCIKQTFADDENLLLNSIFQFEIARRISENFWDEYIKEQWEYVQILKDMINFLYENFDGFWTQDNNFIYYKDEDRDLMMFYDNKLKEHYNKEKEICNKINKCRNIQIQNYTIIDEK